MTKKTHHTSLGFVFGYKESNESIVDGKTIFNIKFKEGLSKNFPNKFKHFKDFWSEEILVGQSSQLFIHPQSYLGFFKDSLAEFTHQDNVNFSQDIFTSRRYLFDYDITFEQFSHLNSFSMAQMYCNLHEVWENDQVLSNTLSQAIGPLFKNDSRSLLGIYQQYKNICTLAYEQEISEALDTEHCVKKIKI